MDMDDTTQTVTPSEREKTISGNEVVITDNGGPGIEDLVARPRGLKVKVCDDIFPGIGNSAAGHSEKKGDITVVSVIINDCDRLLSPQVLKRFTINAGSNSIHGDRSLQDPTIFELRVNKPTNHFDKQAKEYFQPGKKNITSIYVETTAGTVIEEENIQPQTTNALVLDY